MRKRNRGQDLDINARDWNRLCDVAGQRLGQTPGDGARLGANIVWVKNTLGRDLDRYAAVCVGSPVLVEPMTGKNDPVFSLLNGSLRSQQGNGFQSDPVVGILQEPIASNRLGLAQIAGVTPASFINTEGNSGGLNNLTAEFATMSDDKDMLAFAQFGPIRVLHRNLSTTIGNTGTGKYLMVQLGQPASIGSATISYTTNWTGTPNENRTWTNAVGDFVRLGIHGGSETGGLLPADKLYISRLGRYAVIVEWQFNFPTTVTWNAGDRCEWRVNWPVPLAGPLIEYGGFTPGVWTGGSGIGAVGGTPAQAIRGERIFYFSVNGVAPQQEISTPGIECKRIPSSGSASDLTLTGGGTVRVIRFGAPGTSTGNTAGWNAFWTKAKRDASWGRGISDPPI